MKNLLIKLNACEQAKEWVSSKTWIEAYNTCPRGDWMLWLFAKTNPDDLQRITLAKGHCANTVRHLMKDDRSINAVDISIAFGEGKATRNELNKADSAAYAADAAAYAAAYAADAAYAAADSAAYAAYAAADSAAYAADAAYAASYAADAAYAAYAASYAADAAKKANQKLTADICRQYLPIEIWNIN